MITGRPPEQRPPSFQPDTKGTMVTLITALAAGGFVLAGVVVGIRTIVRRRRGGLERRRLAGLGTVDEHRERYR